MPVIAVLPVKSFQLGKGRLAQVLTPASRERLGRGLAERTLATAEEAGLLPVVIAGDEEVAAWSLSVGVPALADPGQGLSAAAEAGVGWAGELGEPWVVLHVDLPLLRVEDLATIPGLAARGQEVIAPSSDGGTSLIGGARTLELTYGPGSYARHLGRLSAPVTLATIGLLHDLDSPNDLESARAHPLGSWLDALLI